MVIFNTVLERFGVDSLDVHLCVARDNGLTVVDACPTKAIHDQFTTSDSFLGAIAEAGLPAPRIEGLGDVQVSHFRAEAGP